MGEYFVKCGRCGGTGDGPDLGEPWTTPCPHCVRGFVPVAVPDGIEALLQRAKALGIPAAVGWAEVGQQYWGSVFPSGYLAHRIEAYGDDPASALAEALRRAEGANGG